MNAKKVKMLRKFARENGISLDYVKRKYQELEPYARDKNYLKILFAEVTKTIGGIRQGRSK